MNSILQIVPHAPGGFDGVGDYALILSRKLRDLFGCESIFAAQNCDQATTVDGVEVLSLRDLSSSKFRWDDLILHYVNYGYQKRGIPFGLISELSRLRRSSGRLLTVFHELYASGPFWQSAFWLRPIQKQIARSVAKLSSACVVSSEAMCQELHALLPNAAAIVHPVISNFGEPAVSSEEMAARDPRRWAICGGTVLVERSVRSLRAMIGKVPQEIAPRQLCIVGGERNSAVESLIQDFRKLEVEYRPALPAPEVSKTLSSCSFGWLDYFDRDDVPTSVLLKSTAFAAFCAHGVIPILPHTGSQICLQGDCLPGPFFVDRSRSHLPIESNRGDIATAHYEWYRNHCSSEGLARAVANALEITATGKAQTFAVTANHSDR